MAHMKEYSRAYIKEAANLALERVEIYPCKACGHPIVGGYCCGHCGSGEGSDHDEPSFIEL